MVSFVYQKATEKTRRSNKKAIVKKANVKKANVKKANVKKKSKNAKVNGYMYLC